MDKRVIDRLMELEAKNPLPLIKWLDRRLTAIEKQLGIEDDIPLCDYPENKRRI